LKVKNETTMNSRFFKLCFRKLLLKMDQLQELQEKWSSENIKVSRLANDEEICAFESAYNARLPQDLKEYFKQVNGTNDQSDSEFIQFYSLDKIKKVSETYDGWHGVPDYKLIVKTLDEHEKYYAFANYNIHVFCYAIKLTASESENEVLVIGGGEYKKIANSFTGFIDLYLNDSDELLF